MKLFISCLILISPFYSFANKDCANVFNFFTGNKISEAEVDKLLKRTVNTQKNLRRNSRKNLRLVKNEQGNPLAFVNMLKRFMNNRQKISSLVFTADNKEMAGEEIAQIIQKEREDLLNLVDPSEKEKIVDLFKHLDREETYPKPSDFLSYIHKYGFIGLDMEYTKRVIDRYKESIERGGMSAQFYLGLLNEFGIEVKPGVRMEVALFWYNKLAELGYAPAQVRLALLHDERAEFIKRDVEETISWYEELLKQGYPPIQAGLALVNNERAEFVNKDIKEKIRWYEELAKQAYAPASARVALMHERGEFVNIDEAIRWYERSAKQGYPPARKKLAELNQLRRKKKNVVGEVFEGIFRPPFY